METKGNSVIISEDTDSEETYKQNLSETVSRQKNPVTVDSWKDSETFSEQNPSETVFVQKHPGEAAVQHTTGKGRRRHSLTARDIAMIGMMTAVVVASKEALSFLANIELVSFWMIMFTIYFTWRVWFVVPLFIVIECTIYSLGIWNLMYLVAWPVLVLVAWLFRKVDSAWLWAIISGAFGLSYGFLCTIVYAILAIANSGFSVGMSSAVVWWVAGIPYDIVHCIGNFVIMLALYHPMRKVMSLLQ